MIQFENIPQINSMIMAIGIGGGGNNTINYMHKQNLQGIRYLICNTDAQVLERSQVENKIQLGPNLTKGLGAGFNPQIGEQATLESKQELVNNLKQGVKMVFLTAGMGGGTGTGGAPVLAQICKELDILTVAIVTTPFNYEGKQRKKCAEEGIKELRKHVDILIVVNNDKIRQYYGNLRISEAFAKVDDVVGNAIRSITNVVYSTGTINVDFADVCTVMKNGGIAIMGVAKVNGLDRAHLVANEALNSPLLNDTDIKGAKQILMNITTPTGEHEITPDEIEIIQKHILDQVGTDTNLIFGLAYDDNLNDDIALTLIITGFHHHVDYEIAKDLQPDTNFSLLNEQTPVETHVVNPDFNFDDTPQKNEVVFHEPLKFENETNPISSQLNIEEDNQKNDTYFSIDEETSSSTNAYNHQEENFDFYNQTPNVQNEAVSNLRKKLFEPYSFDEKKSEIHSKIFHDKTPSEINFNTTIDHSHLENLQNNSSFHFFKDPHSNQFEIKKTQEYTNYYARKNPD